LHFGGGAINLTQNRAEPSASVPDEFLSLIDEHYQLITVSVWGAAIIAADPKRR